MALVTGITLPNDGDSILAQNYNDPITKILAQVNGNLDSTNISTGSLPWEVMASFTNKIPASAMTDSGDVELYRSEAGINFVASGCVWSVVSGLNGTMTAGVVYVSGVRVSVSAVATRAFTASKDTYISVDKNGTLSYQEVANGATAPSLPADSVWLYIGISGASLSGFDDISIRSATSLLLAHRKTGVTTDTLTVSNIPAKNNLRVIINVKSTGGTTNAAIRFNNDSGNNYTARFSVNGGSDGTSIAGSSIVPTQTTAVDHYIVCDILNIASQEKRFNSVTSESANGTANAPTRIDIYAKWANTSSQINRIDVINSSGTGDFATASEVMVYGWD